MDVRNMGVFNGFHSYYIYSLLSMVGHLVKLVILALLVAFAKGRVVYSQLKMRYVCVSHRALVIPRSTMDWSTDPRIHACAARELIPDY